MISSAVYGFVVFVLKVLKMSESNNQTLQRINGTANVKTVLSVIVLFTSLRYSILFTLGLVAGYIISRIFCNVFLKNGRVDSIFLDYGKWKIHLHHWIMGIIVLAGIWTIDYFYLPTFFVGFICGVIIQDIYDYNDWHKVVVKNEDYKK